MLNKYKFPQTKHINREEYMMRPVPIPISPCFEKPCHTPDCERVPYEIPIIDDDTCGCHHGKDKTPKNKGNHFVCPNKRLRIKYVGFIYNSINYIVDLDNKEVIYKPMIENTYRRNKCKVITAISSITNAYSLSFTLKGDDINNIAEVEVYPNRIDTVSVSVTNYRTCCKEVLDDDYVTYEINEIRNMVDFNLNLITRTDYYEVFELNEIGLANIYSYSEAISLIKDIIENIYYEQDMMEVSKNILTSIKSKLEKAKQLADKENDDTEDDEEIDITGDNTNNNDNSGNNTNNNDNSGDNTNNNDNTGD